MINCTLHGVLSALMMMRNHMNNVMVVIAEGKGGDQLPKNYKELVLNNLQFIQRMCRQYQLSSAEDRIIVFWNMWDRPFTYGALAIELKPLLEAFEADLQKEYFYHYRRDKAVMLMMVQGEWADALKAFPSIGSEIDAGVDCYALGHNVACVFHIMRAAEIGMRALAREREVSFAKYPIEWAEWENIIDQIEGKARAATTSMGRGPIRDAARAFYAGAIAHLRALKESRNRVMHTRGPPLDELDAQRAMNQVRDFMNGLSVKIGEKTRRPISLSRWP
jgi:hypothetical protein